MWPDSCVVSQSRNLTKEVNCRTLTKDQLNSDSKQRQQKRCQFFNHFSSQMPTPKIETCVLTRLNDKKTNLKMNILAMIIMEMRSNFSGFVTIISTNGIAALGFPLFVPASRLVWLSKVHGCTQCHGTGSIRASRLIRKNWVHHHCSRLLSLSLALFRCSSLSKLDNKFSIFDWCGTDIKNRPHEIDAMCRWKMLNQFKTGCYIVDENTNSVVSMALTIVYWNIYAICRMPALLLGALRHTRATLDWLTDCTLPW